MAEEMLPAYLIAGTDTAKIDSARARLRARAEQEGGAAALEVIEPVEGRGAPDAEALVSSIPAMSLTQTRRYLLVDGVERWREAQQRMVAEAVSVLPADVTVVLIARGKPAKALVSAVEGAGGAIHSYDAPRGRELPGHLRGEAQRRGFTLQPGAARILAERMGPRPSRLGNELDRLALWAGPRGEVDEADVESMIADTSEAAAWALSDALLERDAVAALEIAEQLIRGGENVTGVIYALASRLRKATAALAELDRGVAEKKVAAGLEMHPYAARQLVGRLRGACSEDLRGATTALADLEVWCRGGSEYGEELALTLALRRAAGLRVDGESLASAA